VHLTNSVWLACVVVCAGLVATRGLDAQPPTRVAPKTRPATAKPVSPRPTPASSHATAPAIDHNAVVKCYCVGCHNEKTKSGGLSLAAFDVSRAAENAEVTEKMIRKLQAA
jgi:hypothetical protein